MSEDPTRLIPPDEKSFQERVLAGLSALASRMDRLEGRFNRLEEKVDGLEEKVDRRLAETRPIWEAVLAKIEQINTELKRLNTKIDNLYKDHFELRTDVTLLSQKVDQLEKTR